MLPYVRSGRFADMKNTDQTADMSTGRLPVPSLHLAVAEYNGQLHKDRHNTS